MSVADAGLSRARPPSAKEGATLFRMGGGGFRSWRKLALDAAAWLSLGFILLPLVFVTWLAFFKQEIPSFPPEGYTLRWFAAILTQKAIIDGFVTSCEVGVAATLIGVLLGVPAALGLVRHQTWWSGGASTVLLLPLVVPAIVLGTAIYVAEVEAEILVYGLGFETPVIGTTGGLIAAHTLIVIPWVVRLVTASLAGFDRSIEEAAQNLGATPLTTLRRITLPAIRPGIVAAALFAFVVSFSNLELSLFLVGAGRTTLPIAILQYLEWKIDPTIAAASVVQIVIIAAAMLITDRFVKLTQVV
jgi:putative spermidine/putrescine transport system permease protein